MRHHRVGTRGHLIDHLANNAVNDAATYDALVGLSAKGAGVTLLARDVEAATTYGRLPLEFELGT